MVSILFETTHKGNEPVQHFFDYGTCIPAISRRFVNALVYAGVDNFELFPATLKNNKTSTQWNDFFALNVLGMINATDVDNSMYEEIMGGDDEGMPPLGVFTAIALYEDRIKPFEFFREPIGNNLIISERVLNKLLEYFPQGGIGIIAHEVILT